MILYHRTTVEAARAIRDTGAWLSREKDSPVYFSNRPDGQAEGYGDTVLAVDVPDNLPTIDDEFPDGEEHYTIPAGAIRPEYILGE